MFRSNTPIVAVLGTGRYGRALTTRLLSAGYDVRVGSRTPDQAAGQHQSSDAVAAASIVFLCVPSFSHHGLMQSLTSHMKDGTILVDISNHGLAAPPRNGLPSIAERLVELAPSNVIIAKALNTLAAETLEKDPLPTVVPPPARIACDDRGAAERLATVMSDIMLAPFIVGPLRRARDLEKIAHSQFPAWHIPSYVSLIVFVFWVTYYSIFTYVAKQPSAIDGVEGQPLRPNADDLPIKMLVHSAAESAMTMFALTFIAGPIATIIQLLRRNGSKPFSTWLTASLNMRKELGLLGLLFMVPHGIAGLMEVPSRLVKLDINLFYMFGVLSYSAFLWLSINSMPSVAMGLSWREARAVFSWLGLLAYLMGAIHHVIYAGYIEKREPSFYPRLGSMPLLPPAWLGFIIVVATFAMRVLVWSPCIALMVRALRLDKRYDTRGGMRDDHEKNDDSKKPEFVDVP